MSDKLRTLLFDPNSPKPAEEQLMFPCGLDFINLPDKEKDFLANRYMASTMHSFYQQADMPLRAMAALFIPLQIFITRLIGSHICNCKFFGPSPRSATAL